MMTKVDKNIIDVKKQIAELLIKATEGMNTEQVLSKLQISNTKWVKLTSGKILLTTHELVHYLTLLGWKLKLDIVKEEDTNA